MSRRATAALGGILLALVLFLVLFLVPALAPGTASARAGEAPTVGTPAFAATSSASLAITVSIDTHDAATTVSVEYVTAGAYRAQRVPGAATTVVIASVPASAAGPSTVTGQVSGLKPGSSYRMRVKAASSGGETVSASVVVTTPRAPKVSFKAKVGKDATTLTKLSVRGLVGAGQETLKLKCQTVAKGCPFGSDTVVASAGSVSWKPDFKGRALKPGAKVGIQVLAAGARVASLTLVIRDDQQPKVKRT